MFPCIGLCHFTPAGALCPAQVCAPGVPRLPLTPWLPPQIPALLWALPLPQLHSSSLTLGDPALETSWCHHSWLERTRGTSWEHRGPCSQGSPNQERQGRGGAQGLPPLLLAIALPSPIHGGPRWLLLCRAAGLAPPCPVLVGFTLLASLPFPSLIT